MKKLYKFYWDCGRSGYLSGAFIREEEEVKELFGKEVTFGEVLGKHSDIYGTLAEEDFEEVPVTEGLVEELDKFYPAGTVVGINPFEYIYQEEYGPVIENEN